MITLVASMEAEAELTRTGSSIDAWLDVALEEELNAFIERARPITPVISGNMKRDYSVGYEGPGHFDVRDEMFYAGWVAYEGTPGGRMKPNPGLKRLIDDEETEMALALVASLSRLVGGS